MQTTFKNDFITGIFIRELKNRFLCEVEINFEKVVCYVPSSCHLSNFLDLYKKKVLLVPTRATNARTKYSLFAVPYKRSYIVLNASMANRAVEASISSRLFAGLGKRKNVIKEHVIDGYKCDLYIKDTGTIIEIKSVISYESKARFPTVYSERSVNQLKKIQLLLKAGKNACFCIVSLHPYIKEIILNQDTEFYKELEQCMNLGMKTYAFTTRLMENDVRIDHEIPISFGTGINMQSIDYENKITM